MKFLLQVGRETRNSRLHFHGDPSYTYACIRTLLGFPPDSLAVFG